MRATHRRGNREPPSVVPVMLTASCIGVVFVYAFSPPLWLNIIVCWIIGTVAVALRWHIWRRRHPIKSMDELREELRKAAKYN